MSEHHPFTGLLESMQPTPTAAAGSSASAAGGGTALSKDQQTFMNTTRSQLRAVSGLADLASGRYQQAAGSFLKVRLFVFLRVLSHVAGDIRSSQLRRDHIGS